MSERGAGGRDKDTPRSVSEGPRAQRPPAASTPAPSKKPRVVIIDDDPPEQPLKATISCFLHGHMGFGPCPTCVKAKQDPPPLKDAQEVPCPRCGALAKARLLMGAWAAVCPKCAHPFCPSGR